MNDPVHADSRVAPLSVGDKTRRSLAVLLPAAATISAILLLGDIECLLGCFPICCGIGLALAFAVTRLRSWLAFLWAISTPVAVAGCSLAIGLNEWEPAEAQIPIATAWLLYTLLLLATSPATLRIVWRWRSVENPTPKLRWRFQVKFMLALMAALSVFLTTVRAMSDKRGEYLIFAIGAATLLLVLGFAFSLFWARLNPVDESDTLGY